MSLSLTLLPGEYAVASVKQMPAFAPGADFYSITVTKDEISVICAVEHLPEGAQAEKGWYAIKIDGTVDLALTGCISSLTTALAYGGVNVLVASTYDTEYILVAGKSIQKAIKSLTSVGYTVDTSLFDKE